MKILRQLWAVVCCAAILLPMCVLPARAQDTVTGAFEGTITNSQTGEPIADAQVDIINQATNLTITKRSSARGRFFQGLLAPGLYRIRVSATGYATREVEQRLLITRTGEVVPVPVALDPAPANPATPPTNPTPTPAVTATPAPPILTARDTATRAETNTSNAQQTGSFNEELITALPLGGTTLTRTFDELPLYLPGVLPAPPTRGNGAGPGQGAGVGSSGQFSINGLRSRANNFTVDGSDNNDEDIGVRRQGFLALIPQSIESVREYQVITLLPPAQFGRNLGAQVNAVSKSGGNLFHGNIYGFLNSSRLNARNFFDTAFGSENFAVRSGNQPVIVASAVGYDPTTVSIVPLNGRALTTRNGSGGEDSFTLAQNGFVLGGPVLRQRSFFFISYERQTLNAVREASFAVPTIAQRGAFNSGASGLFTTPFINAPRVRSLPATTQGDTIFSLYPLPNNPQGVYGANTFTQTLPASGRGTIASGKYDQNFTYRQRQQSLTARYNFTQDRRILPVTGGAIYSSLQPRVRAQNFSFFFNSEVSNPASSVQIFNQLRLSYGRTRLVFDEVRNPNQLASTRFPNTPFLLNAPLLENFTLPSISATGDNVIANTGPVVLRQGGATTESVLGPVGQVSIAGFSPVGVDVFNFPQRRVNNTYQLADQMTLRTGGHTFVFGYDGRRSELNSDLPRNFRPIITFNGAPAARCTNPNPSQCGLAFTGDFLSPLSLAAASAPSGVQQVLTAGTDAGLNLRYYQLNFFGQDDWRIRSNLSLSFGLRYEYNTPVTASNNRVASSFTDPAQSLVPGLAQFTGGRTRIYEPDRNNFAPRLALAYAPGRDRNLVLRAGYGVTYDQILGAVVSQSRNVFPRFVNVNVAGGIGSFITSTPLTIFNPANNSTLVQSGQLNRLNPGVSLAQQIAQINSIASSGGFLPAASGIEITLPARNLKTPYAHQISFGAEREITNNLALSATYVGTVGNDLLRFTTPNLGSNAIVLPLLFSTTQTINNLQFQPQFFGFALSPGSRLANGNVTGGRPVAGVGGVSQFETTATSYYHSLQLQARGRLARSLTFQAAYTLGRVTDDVSDVFDLAGASVLPQNSRTFAGERGRANFDARHRFVYYFVYDVPFESYDGALRALLQDLQVSGTGQFQTGTPFTVNSIYDVNLDGNLTDRLDTTQGLTITDDRRQRLILNADPRTLLAAVGQDGSVPRNTFRTGNLLDLNLAVTKGIRLSERQRLMLRVEVFNFLNRANFGVPVRYLEAPGFGAATDTLTPARRIQFMIRYQF